MNRYEAHCASHRGIAEKLRASFPELRPQALRTVEGVIYGDLRGRYGWRTRRADLAVAYDGKPTYQYYWPRGWLTHNRSTIECALKVRREGNWETAAWLLGRRLHYTRALTPEDARPQITAVNLNEKPRYGWRRYLNVEAAL